MYVADEARTKRQVCVACGNRIGLCCAYNIPSFLKFSLSKGQLSFITIITCHVLLPILQTGMGTKQWATTARTSYTGLLLILLFKESSYRGTNRQFNKNIWAVQKFKPCKSCLMLGDVKRDWKVQPFVEPQTLSKMLQTPQLQFHGTVTGFFFLMGRKDTLFYSYVAWFQVLRIFTYYMQAPKHHSMQLKAREHVCTHTENSLVCCSGTRFAGTL